MPALEYHDNMFFYSGVANQMKFRAIVYYGIICMVLVASGLLGAFFYAINNKCIDFSPLERYHTGRPSIVLDDEGNEWTRFQLDRRDPIHYDQMPLHLIQAFIAAEDWKFFEHHGLSWKGIIRSLVVNLYYGRKVQGASTITQQLVRLLFFDAKKTFTRKLKEQFYALLVEQQFSKQQILEAYLNHAYFGCGIYGVQAASHRFWGINVADLSIEQAATLAGIVQMPEGYCPLVYPLSAQKRRDHVLGNMRKLGFLSAELYEQAKHITVNVSSHDTQINAPHLKEALRLFLEKKVGKEALYCGGLTIQSTINRKNQQIAERAFADHCKIMRKNISAMIDGAAMSIDVRTGAIKALVGGFDYQASKWNRALKARRQMGSVFKPILYAAAMQAGFSFADTEIDEPIEFLQGNQLWKPHNWDHKFIGTMTLAHALARSNNIVAIKTLLRVGIDPVVELAKRFHIKGTLHPYPSLALGCVDVKLKEAAGAFNVFANNGMYVEPHMVEWVKDRYGKALWRYNPVSERVISSVVSGKVAKVLGLNMDRMQRIVYSGSWLSSEAISKTGTTNEARTCWFVGSTPSLTTAIYIGCDDNRPMGDVYPVGTAYPIWKAIHGQLQDPQKTFVYDSHLKPQLIHELTGFAMSDASQEGAIQILV